jgi:diguanylate cyclase (GGDEF)-like protein/PAS domain S-box-containing protein
MTLQKDVLASYDAMLTGDILFDRSITPMVIVDSQRTMVKANIRFCDLFGYSRTEILGQSTAMLTPSLKHFESYKQSFERTRDGSLQSSDLLYRKKDGTLFWVKLTGIPIVTDAQQFVLWSFDDITQEVHAREEIRDRYRELEIIFEKVHAGLVFVVEGVVNRVNQSFLRMLNEEHDNVVGRNVKFFLDCFEKCKTEGTKKTVRFRNRDGHVTIVEREIVPVTKNSHIIVFIDITEHVQEKEVLTKKSQIDGLTGIFNRNTFLQFAQEMLLDPAHEYASFMLFDIDNFKEVNDTYGHDIGDEVLIELVCLIQQLLRREEIFGRFGGEEFGVLFPVAQNQAKTIAQRLLEAIRQHRFTRKKLAVTVSMGLVDNTFSNVFEVMYKEADRLLYLAKNSGRDRLECCAIR